MEILLRPSGDSRLRSGALALAGGFLESEMEASELSASFGRKTESFAEPSRPRNPFESAMPSMMFDKRDSILFNRFSALRAFVKLAPRPDHTISGRGRVRDSTYP